VGFCPCVALPNSATSANNPHKVDERFMATIAANGKV
jgi:hypothetical protein